MYLRLWSLPDAAAIFEDGGGWTHIAGHPAYRVKTVPPLPSEGMRDAPMKGRIFELLWDLLSRHGDEMRIYQPEAVYLGSARGEIQTLVEGILSHARGEVLSPTLSPRTSPGTPGSIIARELRITGPAVVISQTCLSGLIALYEAALYLRAGEGETVLFGAVEAPLTPFFIETMAALRIYTQAPAPPFVRPGSVEGKNTFALGEGAVLGILSHRPISPFRLDRIQVRTAPPRPGVAFPAVDEVALTELLEGMGSAPDFVILHAPGTQQGDTAEWSAVRRVWGSLPALSVKGIAGHSLGAAPLLGLAAALHLMTHRLWYAPPYPAIWGDTAPAAWQDAVIIGLGYGGVMGAIRIRHEP